MAFCTKCGAGVAADAAFCASCGTGRAQSAVTTEAAASAPTRPAITPTPRGQGATNCANCGRSWGPNRNCQFCFQIEGLPTGIVLASPLRRFGEYLLEGLLAVLTLFIGWFIWSLVVYSRGQTPAKQLLGMRVVQLETGRAASWSTMFLREMVAKLVIGIIANVTVVGLVAFLWLLWDKDRQELWDKAVGTIVVCDPAMLLDPRRR